MTLSTSDYILIAAIALPIVAAALAQVSAVLTARKMTAFAKITGMAGRMAADIALALRNLPPGSGREAAKAAMVAAALPELRGEMAASIAIVGAGDPALTQLVARETSKLELLPSKLLPIVLEASDQLTIPARPATNTVSLS